MTSIKADELTFRKDGLADESVETHQAWHSSVLDALLAQASDCIAVKDLQGKYLLINPAGAHFVGYEASEIIGKTDFELFSYETAQLITASDRQVIQSGETQLVEDFLHPLHGEHRYFEAMKCVYKTPGGEVMGIINVVRDITQRKLAEIALKQTNQDLEQFASVVSHDLQAPLRKIMYFSEALEKQCPVLPEEGRDYLRRIQKTARTMGKLVKDMLNLSRVKKNKPQYTAINLKMLIEEAIQEVSLDQQSGKRCFELIDVEQTLEADPTQIRQLFINLFSNALKFQKPGKTPLVRVRAQMTLFNQCLITIRDNGIGFNEQYAAQMFKAFERLHSVSEYPGTGMGLAICERIVQRHHGKIRAEGKVGEGATFYIELPVTQEQMCS